MSSTFFGLTISASGLNVAQAQINTTANNISNVNTTGYSKQQVNTMASSALRAYQSYGTTGTGVEATSITQCRDLYYDNKYWNNQTSLGYYEKKQYYMKQIESYYSETSSKTGFSTVYAKMFNAMSTLQANAGDATVRKEFISDANELMEYFNQMSTNLENLQSSINDEIKTTVSQINSIGEKIAILNKQINIVEQQGSHANELRDQRALLIDDLSKLVSVQTIEADITNTNNPELYTGATSYTVYINGQVFVDNYDFNSLSCVARGTNQRYNQSDVDGLYDIVWSQDGNHFDPTPSGQAGTLKSLLEVRDGNNGENMKGTVTSATVDTITISGLSITDINEFNMPATGTIWVNNKKYSYDGFNFETDDKGNVTGLSLNLKEPITAGEGASMVGKRLQVGESVDFMGIAYYQNQMNLFLRNFCQAFNEIEQSGLTADGSAMGSFFIAKNIQDKSIENDMTESLTATDASGTASGRTDLSSNSNTYYLLTAKSAAVNSKSLKNTDYFSTTADATAGQDAADIVEKLQKLQSDTTIFRGGGGDAFLQCIYADVTVDTQECDIFVTNYTNIQSTIDMQRQSVSGVDEDEEALDLIKFQNAYNLSSKCISIFSELYDRLILETGV